MFTNSNYVGQSPVPNPNPMRLSARVEQLADPQIQEMRAVPVLPFSILNFESYYPLTNPGLLVGGVAVDEWCMFYEVGTDMIHFPGNSSDSIILHQYVCLLTATM